MQAGDESTGMRPTKWNCRVYTVSVTQVCTADVHSPAQRRTVPALVLSSQQLPAPSPHIGADTDRPKSRDWLCRVCRILMQITSRSSSTDRRGCMRSVESQVVLVRIVHDGKMETRDRLVESYISGDGGIAWRQRGSGAESEISPRCITEGLGSAAGGVVMQCSGCYTISYL